MLENGQWRTFRRYEYQIASINVEVGYSGLRYIIAHEQNICNIRHHEVLTKSLREPGTAGDMDIDGRTYRTARCYLSLGMRSLSGRYHDVS